ncbi:uncharacterized protein LOC143684845 isoform X2 [Tamandua tetradactyla]|uniref:uncharacterized protein LOC143684845 isoform X2 n=1 Tax=Tamandua tetradactyla TaxID=48850 RepID=UPI004053CCE9
MLSLITGSLLRRIEKRQALFLLRLVSLSCGVHPDPPSESLASQPALWILDSMFPRSPREPLLRSSSRPSSGIVGFTACPVDFGLGVPTASGIKPGSLAWQVSRMEGEHSTTELPLHPTHALLHVCLSCQGLELLHILFHLPGIQGDMCIVFTDLMNEPVKGVNNGHEELQLFHQGEMITFFKE